MYIGAQLGRGPRDGLMTGLARRTGLLAAPGPHRPRGRRSCSSAWRSAAWLGLGTVLYALAIGPLTQRWLPRWTVPLEGESVRRNA